MTSSMTGTKYARHRIGDTLRCRSRLNRRAEPNTSAFSITQNVAFEHGQLLAQGARLASDRLEREE